VKLVMFTPRELGLERGWPGKLHGETVIQVAAQTLESFFTGGGTSREHAVYQLDDVDFRPPVLRPPSIRWFDDERAFTFGNNASIHLRGANVPYPVDDVRVQTRVAAVIGAHQLVAGFMLVDEHIAPSLAPPKDRDFAVALGPAVVTRDELEPAGFPWEDAAAYAALNTRLRPGDLLVAPLGAVDVAALAV
jgi:hypothetical protein